MKKSLIITIATAATVLSPLTVTYIPDQNDVQSLETKIVETNLQPIPIAQDVNEKGFKVPDMRHYILRETQYVDTNKNNFTDYIGTVFWHEQNGFLIEHMSMRGVVFAYTIMKSRDDPNGYTLISSRCNRIFDQKFLTKEPPYIPACAK